MKSLESYKPLLFINVFVMFFIKIIEMIDFSNEFFVVVIFQLCEASLLV